MERRGSVLTRIFVLLVLVLGMLGCDERDMKDLFFPADEYLEIPVAKYDVRLHCDPYCPSHDNIRAVMAEVRDELMPLGLSHDPYKVWSGYAITFSENIIYWDDLQVWGATMHGRRAIYIYLEDEWRGIRPGVLSWELRLPVVEKEIPYSTEDQKIAWLEERGGL